MRTVWKYPLQFVEGPQAIEVPAGSVPVHVGAQRDVVCVWVDVDLDPSLPTETLRFTVRGTGHKFDHGGDYVGTAMTHGGDLVWHVYEIAGP